jgi:hypothetical protein
MVSRSELIKLREKAKAFPLGVEAMIVQKADLLAQLEEFHMARYYGAGLCTDNGAHAPYELVGITKVDKTIQAEVSIRGHFLVHHFDLITGTCRERPKAVLMPNDEDLCEFFCRYEYLSSRINWQGLQSSVIYDVYTLVTTSS